MIKSDFQGIAEKYLIFKNWRNQFTAMPLKFRIFKRFSVIENHDIHYKNFAKKLTSSHIEGSASQNLLAEFSSFPMSSVTAEKQLLTRKSRRPLFSSLIFRNNSLTWSSWAWSQTVGTALTPIWSHVTFRVFSLRPVT